MFTSGVRHCLSTVSLGTRCLGLGASRQQLLGRLASSHVSFAASSDKPLFLSSAVSRHPGLQWPRSTLSLSRTPGRFGSHPSRFYCSSGENKKDTTGQSSQVSAMEPTAPLSKHDHMSASDDSTSGSSSDQPPPSEEDVRKAEEEAKLAARLEQMRKHKKILIPMVIVFVLADVALLPFALSKYWERTAREATEEAKAMQTDSDEVPRLDVQSSDSQQYDQLSVGAFPAAFVGKWGSTDDFSDANPERLQCFCEMRPDGVFRLVEVKREAPDTAASAPVRHVSGSIEGFDRNGYLQVGVGLGLTSKFHVLDPPKRCNTGQLLMTLCMPGLPNDGTCYVFEQIQD